MLLIIEALLLILAVLGQQDHRPAAVENTFPLDLAKNSVDDLYKGCRKQMKKLVEEEYLNKELKNTEFKLAWEKGNYSFKQPEDGLTKNHSIAIYVYTDNLVFKDFNNDTRSGKRNYKHKSYKWYSLHFLLSDGIQILKKKNAAAEQTKCITTYRGTNITFNEKVKSKEVRFGSFTSSSMKRKSATFFGKVSCFEIYTCEGAEVTNYSKLSHEREVLIPPYEKFNVTAVKTKGQKGAWCDTVFTLNSTGIRSDLNCALFRKQQSP